MDPALLLVLRAAFALLLASAALHKLRDRARFRRVLLAYDIMPTNLVSTVAPAVTVVESALALLWAIGTALPAVAAATAALMLAYAAALHANVRRGRVGIDCGCTGPAASVPIGPPLVQRNLVLAAAALLATLPSTGRSLEAADLASATAATLALSACWLATGRLLALAPRAAALRQRRRPS
jgi:uncharacterized membrane protein YphA (DoxX/SURF4 family)